MSRFEEICYDGEFIDNCTGKTYRVHSGGGCSERIVKLLNDLNDIKNRAMANSHNAHAFLRCYEKAINDLDEEYNDDEPDSRIAKEVLDKLDDYYDKYEKEVNME